MRLDSTKLNQSIFLLNDPGRWSCRYSSRPTVATAIFAEFGDDGQVRLLDISGGIDPDWTNAKDLDITRQDTVEIDPNIWAATERILEDHGAACALSALADFMANNNPEWETFSDALQEGRFSASAWFERDRQNLVLTDSLSNADVVTLWDESVTEALEDGFLQRPRMIRPTDSDWIEPLKAYAQAQGLLSSAKITAKPPVTPARPAAA